MPTAARSSAPPGPIEHATGMHTTFRLLALAIAVAILGYAARGSYFRNATGELSGRFVVASAAAIAAFLLFWTVRSDWAGAAQWLSLALNGQAAALQLIDAGILIHYQHYRLPPEAMADPALRWPLFVVAVQTVLVGAGFVARRRTIREWMRSRSRLGRLL